jgi:hypothetical protein
LEEAARPASIYIFCVHIAQHHDYAERDGDVASLMSPEHWEFYVVPTFTIDHLFGKQKQVRLSVLESSLQQHGYAAVTYEQLDPILRFGGHSNMHRSAAHSPPRPA